jgi:hypothetical protein
MPPIFPERIWWQIVGLCRAGFTQNEIVCDLNIRQGTVSEILIRHSQRRTVKPMVSSGRPRKTSARDDRICYRLCWSNRMKSASVLRQLWQNRINIRLSRATVNRRGLMACRPVQRPRFNDLRKQRRLLWAHQHSRYGLRHWRHVIYTDESRFLLHRSDGRVRVRRQQGKRFREDCVVGTVMAGGSSVHIWGGIHHGGKNWLGCATKFCQRRQISIWIHQILMIFCHIVVPIKIDKRW